MKECPACNACYDDSARFCIQDGSSLAESLPGSRTFHNRYQLIRMIGRGRLGDVYQATDLTNQHQVSVKIIPPNLFTTREAETTFQQEVQRLINISSPYVASTFGYGLLPNAASYLVTEFIEGRTLKDELEEEKILQTPRALEVIRQSAIGLGVAHDAKVLHLDLKPGNLLLMADEVTRELQVKVVDFGLACLKDSLGGAVVTDTGSVIFRMPHYTSPEECTGQATDQRSDVYSLGIILYEMLTGRVPFSEKQPMKVILAHATKAAQPLRDLNSDVPPPVEALVMKMLAKDPAYRPQSMAAVIAAIEQVQPSKKESVMYKDAVNPQAESPQPKVEPDPSSLNLPLRLTIIDTDDEGNKSRTIPGVVHDASPQGMRIQTGTVATGHLNIVKDHTVAFKNRLDIEVDIPTGTVHMDGFAVRYNRAPDGINWIVYIYIKEMPRADRRLYEAYLKTV